MAHSKVTVSFNPHEIYDAIKTTTDVALEDVALDIMVDTNQFVPFNQGPLRDSVNLDKKTRGEFVISYSREIQVGDKIIEGADDLYKGINPVTGKEIVNWTTPGTGPYWLEASKDANLQKWITSLKEETRKRWRNRKRKQRK